MKPTFHHRLVNGPFEDPCLYVRMIRERRAFLFDAGNIGRLTPGELQKISDVFVTHAHIDHFIGFDTLLRALLRRETPLRVYGPETIADCVEGKLRGYTWNVIEEYPIRIEVFGIGEKEVRRSSFYAMNGFARIDREASAFDGIVLKEPPFTVRGIVLSHGIPCLGFSLEEDFHINIDRAALNARGLPVGPWLSEFKRMIRSGDGPDAKLMVDGRELALSDLSGIALITEGQKISYITDISPGEGNIEKVMSLVRRSDTFYCEASFLHEDLERAFERNHVTARIAGEMARKAEVKNLVVMHFSPKYRDFPTILEEEAMREFRRTQ